MENHYDVIIVGAGPGGSTAAMRIAKEGYSVLLLDKSNFPRDKSCGDGLTRTSTKLLHELGVLDHFSTFKKTHGVKVFVGGEGYRQFDYPKSLEEPSYGLVVPRIELDAILFQKAFDNGVNFMSETTVVSLLYEETQKQAIGVQTSTGEKYYADLVIGADGAASKIAYQSSLATTPKDKLGFGLRGYYKNVEGITDQLEIYLPILDSTSKHILPSYGWVFPINENEVNIGVGLIEKTSDDNIRLIMNRFVDTLKKKDPKFKNIELKGKLLGAPMRFDFKPENTYAPGLLLVGDAAGMISPFTGEGIGYALETGMIASDLCIAIQKNKDRDFSDLSEYGKILASKYQGYFETGTTSVNRYHLVWKVLKGTFQNDKPLFSIIRQAAIFPEGIGESFFDYYTVNVSDIIKGHNTALKTDILSISQNIINITREDWPFLSRLFSAKQITPGLPFRPSLFLLLSGYSSKPDRDTLIKLGTAIELGFVASICHDSVMEDETNNGTSSVNWGNMISILIGDFLLSKSFEIIASLDSNYTKIVSEALSNANKGQVLLKEAIENNIQNVTLEEYLALCYLKYSYTFELCFYLGAIAGKVKVSETNTLREFGKYFGTAYFISEDIANYTKSQTNSAKPNSLYTRNEEASLIHILQENQKDRLGRDGKNSLEYCYEIIFNEMDKAKAQTEKIENPQLKESLNGLCDFMLKKELYSQVR